MGTRNNRVDLVINYVSYHCDADHLLHLSLFNSWEYEDTSSGLFLTQECAEFRAGKA